MPKMKTHRGAKKRIKVTGTGKFVIKEIKVTARIDSHDLETKLNQVTKFLEKENKVKVTLVLFGREKMHANLGVTTLDDIAEKFAEIAEVEKKYADKQKHLILSPKKIK